MSSVPKAEAELLSRCHVLGSLFDTLTPDGFWPLIKFEDLDAGCLSNPVIEDSDKPLVGFVASGGAISVAPVAYGTSLSMSLTRIVARIQLDGDLATNVSQVNDVLADQTSALAAVVQERVSTELWADTPVTNAPIGMSTFGSAGVNPVGPQDPITGVGTPLTPNDLRAQRELMRPWSPDSNLYHVMPTKLYMRLHQMSWDVGSPLEYRPDPHSGMVLPHFDGLPVVANDHISLNEGGLGTTSSYLVRVGESDREHVKVAGFRGYTAADAPGLRITSSRPNSGAEDEVFAEVEFNLLWHPGSRSSVLRTKGFSS